MIRLVFDCLRSPYDFANVLQVVLALGPGECEMHVTGNSMRHDHRKISGKVSSWSKRLKSTGLPRLPIFYYASFDECVTALQLQGIRLIGTSPHSEKSLYDVDFRNNDIAVVFGTETSGLTEAKSSRLDDMVKIPMSEYIDFMTLSVCVPIVAYEIFRQRTPGTVS